MVPFSKKNNWLLFHRKDVFSQFGEDGILEKIFKIMNIPRGWCVEFGAWDGIRFSNTRNLILNKGWSGVLIEADGRRARQLRKTYNNNKKITCFCRLVNFEGPDSLDNILRETQIPKSLDLLSIDIDGNDYHVWDSLKTYKPKVVIIEFNPSFPDYTEWVQPRDMGVHQGHSLFSLTKLGKSKGYELITAVDTNAIFVKRRHFKLFGINDKSLPVLRTDSPYQTHLAQLYDGTLLLLGCDRLIWKGIQIMQKDIQVLPRALRVFEGKKQKAMLWALQALGVYKPRTSLKKIINRKKILEFLGY